MPQPAVHCRLQKEHLPHFQKDSALPFSFLTSAADWKYKYSALFRRIKCSDLQVRCVDYH